MGKIIIKTGKGIDDATALALVQQVVKQGLLSDTLHGRCYCFVTTFQGGHRVYADLTKKGTHTLRVVYDHNKFRGLSASMGIVDELANTTDREPVKP